MNFTKATDKQLKTIIEWDSGIPTLLLKEVYEEIMNRRMMDKTIFRWIYSYFKTKGNAEYKTGLTPEDLLWICYEIGYEIMDNYKSTHAFIGYWHKACSYEFWNILVRHTAKKRHTELCSLDDIHEWITPGGNPTETIALNRIQIESMMNQLNDMEKDMVIKRSQGYTNREIGKMYGKSKTAINKRMLRFQKRLRGA